MKYTLRDINESFTELDTEDFEFIQKMKNTLSVYVEGYKFDPRFKIGVWDGKKHFWKIHNEKLYFTKGLVQYILDDLEEQNIPYTYDKISENYPITEEELKKFIKSLDIPFEPYDYQFSAVLASIKEKRLVLRSSTSSGKSLIIYIVLRYLHSKGFNSVLVVPSINLVDQMYTDFIDYGWNDIYKFVKQIGGEHKSSKELSEKPIIISTWQSLMRISKEEFEIFDCIIVDECHSAKGDVLNSIITNSINCSWKLGLTGTVPRKMEDKLMLLGALGRVETVITPGQLIQRGLATPIEIKSIFLRYSDSDCRNFKRNKLDYHKEVKYIEEHYYRNNKVANIVNKIGITGNTLGMFSHISHGEYLLKMIIGLRAGIEGSVEYLNKPTPKKILEMYKRLKKEDFTLFVSNRMELKEFKKHLKNILKEYPEEETEIVDFLEGIKDTYSYDIFFIVGEVKGSEREIIRSRLEEIHPKEIGRGAIILGNYGVVSTGVNYKNLHNIVYLSSLKAYTKIVQSIGRGMRLHKSKDKVNIYDMIDVLKEGKEVYHCNYSLRHFYDRFEYYMDDEYDVVEVDIKLKGDSLRQEFDEYSKEW